MATLIPNTTRHEIARSIYRDIITDRDYYYIFGGKSLPWGSPDIPETPQDTQNYLTEIHKNILFVNRVTPGPSDVVYMVRRIDWVSGTVYDEYRDDVDMLNKNFYVIHNNRIYKCLANGTQSTRISFNAASSNVNITDNTIYIASHGLVTGNRVVYSSKGGTAIGGLTTGVIYYVIRLNDNIIKLALTEQDAADNIPIDFISLGAGSNNHEIIKRTGSASTVAPEGIDILPFVTSDEYVWKFMYEVPELDRVKFLNDDYIPVRNISDGVNFDTNGVINYVDIVETGINYTAPQILFEGDGTGAAATISLDEVGSITSINITASGLGYTHCRVRVVDIHAEPKNFDEAGFAGSINVSAGNTVVTGTGTLFVDQISEGWSLVDLDNNFIGVVREVLSNTQLLLELPAAIDITSSGVLNYALFTGSGFIGSPILERETSYYTNQQVVETTMPGSIYNIEVLDGGAGYVNPVIVPYGDGTGLVVSATTNVDGEITQVLIEPELSGTNYHYVDFSITGFYDLPAVFKAHIGPEGGHGSNIAKELFATSLCINTVIKTDNPDLFVGNDIRQIGIMKNIKKFDDVVPFVENTGTGCYILEVSSTDYADYLPDDLIEFYYITDASNRGLFKVVTKYSKTVNDVIRYYVFVSYMNGLKNISVANGVLINNLRVAGDEGYSCLSITEPEINKHSGSIIYVNNVSPIQRTSEQVETIKLFLHF